MVPQLLQALISETGSAGGNPLPLATEAFQRTPIYRLTAIPTLRQTYQLGNRFLTVSTQTLARMSCFLGLAALHLSMRIRISQAPTS